MRASPAGVVVIPSGITTTVDDACRLWLTDDGNGLACGDSLLRGAAATVGPATIGVVLTGMLCDGTEGVRAIKRRSAEIIFDGKPFTLLRDGGQGLGEPSSCQFRIKPAHQCLGRPPLTRKPGDRDGVRVYTRDAGPGLSHE